MALYDRRKPAGWVQSGTNSAATTPETAEQGAEPSQQTNPADAAADHDLPAEGRADLDSQENEVPCQAHPVRRIPRPPPVDKPIQPDGQQGEACPAEGRADHNSQATTSSTSPPNTGFGRKLNPNATVAKQAAAGNQAPKSSGDVVTTMNAIHFVVPVAGKVFIATEQRDPATGHLDLQLSTERDFALLYSYWRVQVSDEKTVPATARWLASRDRRQYAGIEFMPGPVVEGLYNLWQGFAVEAVTGDASLFWQHLETVICQGNTEHYLYLRRWLAHLVQRPAELPEVAIVIRGRQGTGKTIFVNTVGCLLGQHFMVLTRMEQLTGRFSGHLKDALLVSAEEAIWGGDKAGEGALKALITNPITPVEEKHKNLYNVRNYKRLIVTTNEPWAVPMGIDDRRFLVLEASDARKEDKTYFRALAEQMANGGLQALLWDLQHEDLAGFDVRTKPASPHGFDIKLRSADPLTRWWFETLHKGTAVVGLEFNEDTDHWETVPLKDHLHGSFQAFCDTHRLRSLAPSQFGKELRKLIPGHTVSETRPHAAPTSGTVGRPRHYRLPTLAECRAAFEVYAKAGPEIWQ